MCLNSNTWCNEHAIQHRHFYQYFIFVNCFDVLCNIFFKNTFLKMATIGG